MRVYFHNPFFSIFYGINVFNKLTGRFNHNKYGYITEHIIKKKKGQVGIYVDLDQNSFGMFFFYKIKWLNRIITLLEFIAWLFLNRVNPLNVKIVFSSKSMRRGDIFFSFSFDNLDRAPSEGRMYFLKNFPEGVLKIFHLTHYMFGTSNIAVNSRNVGVDFFVAESNLGRYPYFKNYFGEKDVYLLPFVFQDRFSNKTPFRERKNRCCAMGTLTILAPTGKTRDVMDFFKTDTIHPMRKAIYENREMIKDRIDTFISYYNEETKFKELDPVNDGAFTKMRKALWNAFAAKQKDYFRVSAEDRFNQYRMFVVPEEINNLPGISFVEGMACGCAYIGIDDPMYRDIGLTPGIHYITYDNTLDGLLDVVEYYRNHEDKLEKIAATGYEFVTDRFNGKMVAEKFWRDLILLAQEEDKGNGVPVKFKSSFVLQV